eukprot:6206897-Pleurochrysis_carterae.AAC.3
MVEAEAQQHSACDAPAGALTPECNYGRPSHALAMRADYVDDTTEGGVQSYAAFRQMLGLVPSVGEVPLPIPLEAVMDHAGVPQMSEAEQTGETAVDVSFPSSSTATSESRQDRPPAADDDLDIEFEEALELGPGSSRDVTRSPRHLRLQMDNFVGDEGDDSGDERASVDSADQNDNGDRGGGSVGSIGSVGGSGGLVGDGGDGDDAVGDDDDEGGGDDDEDDALLLSLPLPDGSATHQPGSPFPAAACDSAAIQVAATSTCAAPTPIRMGASDSAEPAPESAVAATTAVAGTVSTQSSSSPGTPLPAAARTALSAEAMDALKYVVRSGDIWENRPEDADRAAADDDNTATVHGDVGGCGRGGDSQSSPVRDTSAEECRIPAGVAATTRTNVKGGVPAATSCASHASGTSIDTQGLDTARNSLPPAHPFTDAATFFTAGPDATFTAGMDAIAPFSLDPDFDYENVQLSERFTIERALREGEFYDIHPQNP